MPTELLRPKTYQAFKNMELLARSVVEGFTTGLHRSPFKGFAIEFAEHRQYVPGDDLRHLDWKIVGKLERYYIKQYEEDTSLKAYVVLDTSGSMGYRSGRHSKLDYGRFIAGVMSYLLLQQQDAVGLVTCDHSVTRYLPARSTRPHFKRMMDTLEAVTPEGETRLGQVLHLLAERTRRRALIIIISDLFDDPDQINLALTHFAHKRHEVVVFRVLAREEATFTFEQPTRFEDLESSHHEEVDPRQFRRDYVRLFEEHRAKIRKTCFERRIDLTEMYLDEPFERAMARYLVERLKRS
jgi:uncharacterized protein (DUF58 family)